MGGDRDADVMKSAKQSEGFPPIAVTIETPKGSRNKFKYDPAKRTYELSRVLPEGMVFPHDFGFVPKTKSGDGDPIDVLVLTDEPLFPGCMVSCSLIGVIEEEQTEEGEVMRNDRLVAVAQASLLYSEMKNVDDLNPVMRAQIEDFFRSNKKEPGVSVRILGWRGPEEGRELLRRSRKRD